MYELYEYIAENENENKIDLTLKCGIFVPSIFRLCLQNEGFIQWLKNLYWFIISGGKYSIYFVCQQEEIIHTSYCIPRCYKFPFMDKNDIQIGPCNTNAKYRGMRIYPYVLSNIVRDFYKNNTRVYMIIHQMNTSSQKGAHKVGFRSINLLKKNNYLKIYKVID